MPNAERDELKAQRIAGWAIKARTIANRNAREAQENQITRIVGDTITRIQ